MTDLSYPPAVREQILAALEAGSAALRALEVAAMLSAEGEGSHADGGDPFDRAIELLRESIQELRRAEGEEPRVGSTGFVLAVRRRRRRNEPSQPPEPPQPD
jgi:hypothetical protein